MGSLRLIQLAGDNYYGVTLTLFAFTFALMVLAAFKNPGEFPKIVTLEMTQRKRGDQTDLPYTSWSDQTSVINMCLSNSYSKIKFCKTCRIYRPPRTTHCRACDRCVSQFDHHCTLLGTCVGRNNYRAFFFFLFAGSLLTFALISFSVRLYFQFNSAQFEMDLSSWAIVLAIFGINLLNFSVG